MKSQCFCPTTLEILMKVSASEIADILGVSRQAIQKAISSQRLNHSVEKVNGRYQLDVTSALKEWHENSAKPRSSISNSPMIQGFDPSALPSYSESRARKEYYLAEQEKLKLKFKQGEIISRKEVNDHMFTISRLTRDAFSNIPDRLSTELAGKEPKQIHKRLSEEIRQAQKNLHLNLKGELERKE
jgi:predicted DNA-binding protein (UPF0251 family)